MSIINQDTLWPKPTPGQETLILLATRGLRQGPLSPLARLVRQFEPFWRQCQPPPLIFAVEGSYRALLRCGLLKEYPAFYCLPPGYRGALVYASDIVISAATKDPDDISQPDPYPVRVFYLIDPADPTSTYPETVALKRDSVVAGKTFLATEAGVEEWLTLELYARVGLNAQTAPRFWLDAKESALLQKAIVSPDSPKTNIALVAHDNKKRNLLRFALEHFKFLRDRFGSRYATGTTGDLLNGSQPARPLVDAAIESPRKALAARLNGTLWVSPQPSGPRGGDIQIARRILDGQCRTVIFFEDPHYAREHEADIQLLERTSRVPDLRVLCLHDRRSAQTWASNWEHCLSKDIHSPSTLVRAYRQLFSVDLVLSAIQPDLASVNGASEEIWETILETAAFYLMSLVSSFTRDRREKDDPLRVGITWGFGIHELIEKMLSLTDTLQQLDTEADRKLQASHVPSRPWPPGLTERLADRRFLRPMRVRLVPVIGVMGAYDRRVEANANATFLADSLGGEALQLGDYAFYLEEMDGNRHPLEAEWRQLDVLVLTGDQAKPQFGSKVHADVPRELWQSVQGAVGECAGLYLDADGSAWSTGRFRRQGISHSAVRHVAARGGSILIAGVQDRRRPVASAMLAGGLVSTFITDLDFAWRILRRRIGL